MAVAPKGWIEVPSTVEGICVFAPQERPEPDVAPEERVFRCPSCGAPTRFDPARGAVSCPACDYAEDRTADRAAVGRSAAQSEFSITAIRAAEQGWGVQRKQLSCESCGAVLTLETGHLSATCPFCLSSQVRVDEREVPGLRPGSLVPFKLSASELPALLTDFLGRGWMHPADLPKAIVPESFSGIYLPYWLFTATLKSSWAAEVGHTVTRTVHRNGKRETTSEVVWRHETGHHVLSREDLPVQGTTRLSSYLLEQLCPWEVDDLVPYEPRWLAGFDAMAYDRGLIESWDIGRQVLQAASEEGCRGQASTSKIRNMRISTEVDDEAWRYVLLPVYLTTYRYNDTTWQVLVNGQSGEFVGQKPVAWWKIWCVITLLLTPGVAGLLLSIPALLLGGAGLVTAVIAALLLVIGGVASAAIYGWATASERA